ncbi:LPD1 domain-containing protein [Treponema pedis]|uniref:LPD1 domain-containing protein n=1 Tax=Treponema pedis TaxID=409322 RepID=UPI000466C465|nr:LPD1 domain-containing protein [Treponema pedis]
MQITVSKEAGFRMLKSINGFLQADSADEFFIQKAIGHKYLRKIPKKSGKGYWYIYAETFKRPLQFLQQVFNISKERINKEFEENNIEKEYGVDKQTYSAHVLEYLTNKLKWDNLFFKSEKREQYKKAVNTKKVKTTQNENTGKKKDTADKDSGDKIVVNRTLMYKVWRLYNKKSEGSGGEPPDDGYPEKNYPEYKGKGQEAVNFIVKQKGGQVKGAFNRPEIGDIDVVWGKITDKEKHTGYGLSHIIDKHGMDAVNKIGEIIKNGEVYRDKRNRLCIKNNNTEIALKEDWFGNKKNWIVTSYKIEERAKTITSSSNYTGETLPETSTISVPQLEKKNNSLSEAMKGNQNAKKEFSKTEKERKVKNEKRKTAGLPQTELFERESAIKDSTWDPNSEEYRYKDTGYIAGSRKELAQNYIKRMAKEKQQVMEHSIDWEGLEENPRLAKKLITKSNIFGTVDWDSLKNNGMEGGAAFLIDRIYTSVAASPDDNPESRRNYIIAVNGLRDRFETCKTVQDISKTLEEIRDEMDGCMLSAEKQPEYTALAEQLNALWPAKDNFKQIDAIFDKMVQIKERAREAAFLNPLYKAWSSLGEKFIHIAKRRSDSFFVHYANAKRGLYDNWQWVDKEKKVREKTNQQQEKFDLLVASKFTRKGGRNVKAASTLELKKMFNLRDIQSGNWVLKDPTSAKFHVDHACEGFADLADITGIPDSLISLNGRLALAIGARGKGGLKTAAAHYEPIERVINITKMKGGGSLAHEWFHAFDNLISEAMQGGNVNKFLTNPYKDMSKKKADLLKEYMEIKNSSTIRQSAKELSLFVLKRKLDKEGIKLPEEGSGEDYMLKIHAAFDKLVSSMMEGNEPIVHNVFYSADDYRLAQYNLKEPKGDFAKKIKNAGSLEKAVEIINQRFGGATDKKIIKNKSDWIRITVAYYDGKEKGGYAQVDSGNRSSSFYKAAKSLDGSGKTYWSAPHEMAARAFSAYIDDSLRAQGRFNDYLAFATTNDFYKNPLFENVSPYPEGEERERINTAFKELFDVVKTTGAIRKALQFKPVKGVKYVLLVKNKEVRLWHKV